MNNTFEPVPDFEEDPSYLDLTPLPASETEPTPVPEPTPESDDPDEFPEEVHEDVHGLLFLGALSTEVELWGHKVVLRTLKAGEELAVGQIVSEYNETPSQGKAFAIATVAASIETVDGRIISKPIGPSDSLASIRQKFEYIRENWHWPFIETIYFEYSQLVVRQAMAFDALEGKLRASQLTS
jgi:hypothetical protein